MGGSSTKTKSTTQIPEYLEDAFKNQLSRADTISKQGYTPYMGADTAAFAPQQVNAMQSAADWSSAFGGPNAQRADVASSIPPARQFQDGTTGYSSFGGYENMLAQMKQQFPGQYAYIRSMSVDPMTGQQKDFEDYMPGGSSGSSKDNDDKYGDWKSGKSSKSSKNSKSSSSLDDWWDKWSDVAGQFDYSTLPAGVKDLLSPEEFAKRLAEMNISSGSSSKKSSNSGSSRNSGNYDWYAENR